MVAGAAAFLTLSGSALLSQDTRHVTEPSIPSSCTVLSATLKNVGDSTITESDERNPDTRRIQKALDACPRGKAVVLKSGGSASAFLTGPLLLRPGVALVVDQSATLYGSRNPRDYDVSPGSCGVINDQGKGCRALITGDRAAGSAVIGPGTIDGRGWAKLAGQSTSWWDLAQEAKVKNRSQNCPRMMQITRSDDFTLYRIQLRNSPNFHVVFDRGNGFTAWGVIINTPKTARNTDGIDPMSSSNVTITRSFIHTGDDDIAIKAGSAGPSLNVTVSHNHFYSGHGVSIGSETNGGVRAIRVSDLSIDGNDNGLRIKSNASRGGVVEDVEYRDVCIRNTKNPVEMDTHYSASLQTTGNLIPFFRGILLKDIRVLDGGQVTLDGYDAQHPLRMTLDNVVFDKPAAIKLHALHAAITEGPGPVSLQLVGEDVRVSGAMSEGPPNACTGKFIPLPPTPTSVVPTGFAAIVDAGFSGPDGAPVDGVPTYRSLGAALTGLPVNGGARTIVFIRNGRYHEKLTVDRPRVTLLGESRDGTILSYDAAADTPQPGGGTYGTRGSFTLRIVAPDFLAQNLTIENSFDYPTNFAKPDSDATKLRNPQAVALMTDLGSDRAMFINVRVTGYQDTLFLNSGRAYLYRCEISGHVDFIFGAGQAVFDDCDIISRDRGSKTNNGYVTAPSTNVDQPYGFLFVHSRLKKESPQMAPNTVALGRPWHPFANPKAVGSSVFVDTWMDDHIGAKGWERMSSMDSTGTRIWYEPASARFFEYGSRGPGAVSSPARRVLTADEAKRYTPMNVLGGWNPRLMK